MVGDDLTALLEAPKKSGVSFGKLIDGSRTHVIDITGKEKKTVGAAMSSRMMVETVIDGKPVKGFFTKETVRDPSAEYAQIVRDLSAKYPLYRDFFENMAKPDDRPDTHHLNAYSGLFSLPSGIGTIHTKEELDRVMKTFAQNETPGIAALRRVYKEHGTEPEFSIALSEASAAIRGLQGTEIINKHTLKIGLRENIDERNCAMSAIAELMGCGNVLAKSVKIAVKDGDTIQKGTFMAFAEGVERGDVSVDNPMLHADEKTYTDSSAWPSIAQMQMLDFICGNIDRHADNLFYQYEKTPEGFRFKGGQGIDNDSSFSLFVPKNAHDSQNKLPSIHDLRVIDEKSAAMLSTLTPGILKTVLRAYNLPEAAIDACIKRTEMLQNAVQAYKESGKDLSDPATLKNLCDDPDKPLIAVVKDEEWKNLSLDDLTNGLEKRNGFSNVKMTIKQPLEFMKPELTDKTKETRLNAAVATVHLNAAVTHLGSYEKKLGKPHFR